MTFHCPLCARPFPLDSACGHCDRRLAHLFRVGHSVKEIVAWRRYECPGLTEQHVEDAIRRVVQGRTLPERDR